MFSRLTFALALIALAGLLGCSAGLDAKLGGQNERCYVDDDCQTGLICDRGQCTGGDGPGNNGRNNGSNNGQNNGRNNGQNNGFNNGQNNGFNNGEDIEQLCYEVCDYFGECTGEWDDECGADCYDQLTNFPEDQAYDLLYCLLDASCNDIRNGAVEECLDMAPIVDERQPYCEDLSKFVSEEICPRQGIGEEMYEFCTDAAQWHSDDNFWRLEECLQEGCDDILECVYDWYERG